MCNDDFKKAIYKKIMPKKDDACNIHFIKPIICTYDDFRENHIVSVEKINLRHKIFYGYLASNYSLTGISLDKLDAPCLKEAIDEVYPEYCV